MLEAVMSDPRTVRDAGRQARGVRRGSRSHSCPGVATAGRDPRGVRERSEDHDIASPAAGFPAAASYRRCAVVTQLFHRQRRRRAAGQDQGISPGAGSPGLKAPPAPAGLSHQSSRLEGACDGVLGHDHATHWHRTRAAACGCRPDRRTNRLAISVYDTHGKIVAQCCDAWNFFATPCSRRPMRMTFL